MSDATLSRSRRAIRGALVLAGVQIMGAGLLALAHAKFGWIDRETMTRAVMVLIGLSLAAIGNGMPKTDEGPPQQSVGDIVVRQSILRVGGWAMLLGGLVWAGLWAFAPRDLALPGSVAAVFAGVVVMIGHAVWRYRSSRSPGA
jgi:hypothetical protein